MRKQDKLRLFELHSTDVKSLHAAFNKGDRRVQIQQADGYKNLKSQLPPQSRRGMVLVDPSYELEADYHNTIAAVKDGIKRFATGIYAIWYPVISKGSASQLPERLCKLLPNAWLQVQLNVVAADNSGLTGSGLIVLNPPWKLHAHLTKSLPELRTLLQDDEGAGFILATSDDAG